MKPWAFVPRAMHTFMALMTAPSSEENMKLGAKAVFHASLHRCADIQIRFNHEP